MILWAFLFLLLDVTHHGLCLGDSPAVKYESGSLENRRQFRDDLLNQVREDDEDENAVMDAVSLDKKWKQKLVEEIPDPAMGLLLKSSSIDNENGGFSERPINNSGPVAPLHVTNSARQQCVQGYQVDENGVCQKTLTPKGGKSFTQASPSVASLKSLSNLDSGTTSQNLNLTLVVAYCDRQGEFLGCILISRDFRRLICKSHSNLGVLCAVNPLTVAYYDSFHLRRRREADAPKISYADVVKFGLNPPKLYQTTTEKAEVLTTSQKSSTPTSEVKATTPKVQVKVQADSTSTSKPEATTIKAPVQSNKALPATLTTAAPQSAAAASGKVTATATAKSVPSSTPVPALGTATAVATADGGVAVAKAGDSSSTSKPSMIGSAVAKIGKIPGKITSALGDINTAFLSGEKNSAVLQNQDGQVNPPSGDKKDIPRLRRWSGLF